MITPPSYKATVTETTKKASTPALIVTNGRIIPPSVPVYPLPIIDKLALSLKPPSTDQTAIRKKLWHLIDIAPWAAQAHGGEWYQHGTQLTCPHTKQVVYIAHSPAKPYLPFMRFEFNPSKLGTKGMQWLRNILAKFLPDGWAYLLGYATVSRVDFAVDLPNETLDLFHLLPKRYSGMSKFVADGELESIYSDPKKGDCLCIYRPDKNALKKGLPWHGPPMVRVEVRHKPKSTGLKDLPHLKNPFEKVVLVLPLPGPPPLFCPKRWTLFMLAAKEIDVGPALQLFEEKYRKIMRAHIKANPYPRWDPHEVWKHRPHAFDVLGPLADVPIESLQFN